MENIQAPNGEAAFSPRNYEINIAEVESYEVEVEEEIFETETKTQTEQGALYVGPSWTAIDRHFGYVDSGKLFLNGEVQTFAGAENIISSLRERGSYDSKFNDVAKQVECLARYTLEAGLVTLTIYEAGSSGIIEDAPEKKETELATLSELYDEHENFDEYKNEDYQTDIIRSAHSTRSMETARHHSEPATHIEQSAAFHREAHQIAQTTGIQIVIDTEIPINTEPSPPLQVSTKSTLRKF